MGTRDADDRIIRRIYTQGTEQLGFFAPHDIRSLGVSLRNPRKDPDVTGLSGNRDGTLKDACEMRRRVDVSSLNPPLPGTRHAADHNRQVIRGANGIEMRLQHGREAELAAAIMPSWLRRSSRTPPARSMSQSRKLLVPQSTATYSAWLISCSS